MRKRYLALGLIVFVLGVLVGQFAPTLHAGAGLSSFMKIFMADDVVLKKSGDVKLVIQSETATPTADAVLLDIRTGTGAGTTKFSVDEDGDLLSLGGANFNSDQFVVQTSSGNVGVGVAAPGAHFHVSNAGTPIMQVATSATSSQDAVLQIRGARTTSTTGDIAQLEFHNDESGGAFQGAEISLRNADATSGTANADLLFSTNSGAGLVEAMRIDDNGNVGIGSVSPGSALDVNGTVTATAFSGNGASVTNVDAATLDSIDSANFLRSNIADTMNGTLTMAADIAMGNNDITGVQDITSTNATFPRLVLDSISSGDNWTSQGAYISIGESGALGAAALHMTYRGDGYGWIGSGAVTNAEPGASYLRFDYNADHIYTPDNIGIGSQTPAYPLDVVGSMRSSSEIISTTSNGLRIVSGNYGVIQRNDGTNFWELVTASGDQYGTWNTLRPIYWNLADGNVALGNGALYVEHGANVGIGDTTPTYKLDVAGTGRFTGEVTIGAGITGIEGFSVDADETVLYDDATSNSPYSQVNADGFHTNGLGVGQLFIEGRAIDSNSIIEISGGNAGGQASQDVYIGDNNEIFVDTSANNVGIGTTTLGAKLVVSGNVIASDPTASNHVATKSYVDSSGSGHDPPSDWVTTTCNSLAWATDATYTGSGWVHFLSFKFYTTSALTYYRYPYKIRIIIDGTTVHDFNYTDAGHEDSYWEEADGDFHQVYKVPVNLRFTTSLTIQSDDQSTYDSTSYAMWSKD